MIQELSKELYFLIQSIKGQNCIIDPLPLLSNPTYDLPRFQQLIRYHGLQALLFEVDKKSPFLNDTLKLELTQFMQRQVITNLQYQVESNRLLTLFASQNIPLLLLKGNLFIQRVYNNKQLRTTSDLDVLVQKKHLSQSLEILLNDGYRIQSPNHVNYEKLPTDLENFIVQKSLHNEIHLVKGEFNLDFHWDIFQYLFYQKYQERKPLIDEIFQLTETVEVRGLKIQQLNTEGIFWTIMAHHGAKESWLRLRHMQDLNAFMHQYAAKMDWESILPKLEMYRLNQPFKNALYLLKFYFNFPLPPLLENELRQFDTQGIKIIIKEWERGIYWTKNRQEIIRHWWLLGRLQDYQFSYLSHGLAYFKYFMNIKKLEAYPNKFGLFQITVSFLKLFQRLIQKK